MNINLPYKYEPRPYQLPFLKAFDQNVYHGGKIRKFVKVWHRRAGKEKTDLNLFPKAMQHRVGSYYYFFPTFKQGKKILWDGMDKTGFPFLGHFPTELLAGKPNNTEMKLKYKNGSLFQVIGTDDINSIVGTNPIGCVFSEYSLQDPKAWDFMRPIVAENDGWAGFNFTPRGENHGKDLYDLALSDPKNFYCQLLTVKDTNAIPQEVLDQERAEIIRLHGNDALYQQEYMCSFTAPIAGAYYANWMTKMYEEGRVCHVPYDTATPVDTYWDLGIDDSMSIGFIQIVGKEIHLIDYIEGQGEGLPYYFGLMQEKPYIYGEHYAPHDIKARELTSGKSRLETAAKLGLRFQVAPKLKVNEGIHAVRMLLGNMWVDNKNCKRLLDALKSYQKDYDDMNKVYMNKPLHNWASHGADMMRTFGTSFNARRMLGQTRQSRFAKEKAQIPIGSLARKNIEHNVGVSDISAS